MNEVSEFFSGNRNWG